MKTRIKKLTLKNGTVTHVAQHRYSIPLAAALVFSAIPILGWLILYSVYNNWYNLNKNFNNSKPFHKAVYDIEAEAKEFINYYLFIEHEKDLKQVAKVEYIKYP